MKSYSSREVLKKYYVFPAVLYQEEKDVSIEFPDLPGCVPCADTVENAMQNAKEALGLHLFGMEQDNEPIPTPSRVEDIQADDGGIITLVETFMPTIRDKMNNRVVKKTLTIPAWLNRAAEAENVNFSQVLQDGLKQYLSRP